MIQHWQKITGFLRLRFFGKLIFDWGWWMMMMDDGWCNPPPTTKKKRQTKTVGFGDLKKKQSQDQILKIPRLVGEPSWTPRNPRDLASQLAASQKNGPENGTVGGLFSSNAKQLKIFVDASFDSWRILLMVQKSGLSPDIWQIYTIIYAMVCAPSKGWLASEFLKHQK